MVFYHIARLCNFASNASNQHGPAGFIVNVMIEIVFKSLAWLVIISGMTACEKKKDTGAHYSLGISTGHSSYVLQTDHLEDGTLNARDGIPISATGLLTSGQYGYVYSREEKKFY